jgi:hypothetical protein
MVDCCLYYVAQVKTQAGTWINLEISSKLLTEVNEQLAKYLLKNPNSITRVAQRSIKEDRTAGKKVPGCC